MKYIFYIGVSIMVLGLIAVMATSLRKARKRKYRLTLLRKYKKRRKKENTWKRRRMKEDLGL